MDIPSGSSKEENNIKNNPQKFVEEPVFQKDNYPDIKEKGIYISQNNNENQNFFNSKEVKIGTYEEAPDYLKDNEYIRRGYLLNCHSIKLVLHSLFKCSNETVNIWSHLLGSILAIILIFLTGVFVQRTIIKRLTNSEFEELKLNFNETITPWAELLKKEKENRIEFGNNKSEIYPYLQSIEGKTKNIMDNFGNKKNILINIADYISDLRKDIYKIKNLTFTINETKIKNDMLLNWNICENKIINYFKEENKNEKENEKIETFIIKDILDKEKIGRWPLFIMLSASIICLGFSTIFHWFGIYNKEIYKVLTRLDYGGICFLIAGSCYPPYFYFYYCQKCKK